MCIISIKNLLFRSRESTKILELLRCASEVVFRLEPHIGFRQIILSAKKLASPSVMGLELTIPRSEV